MRQHYSLSLSHSLSLSPLQTFVINIMATAALTAGNGNGNGRGDSKMAYTHCGFASGEKGIARRREGEVAGGVGAAAVHPQIVVSLCRFYVALRRCHWPCCLTSNKTKYTHIKLIIKGPKGN